MKRRFFALFLVAGALVLGLLIYVTLRTDALYINAWVTELIGTPAKEFLAGSLIGFQIPSTIIYSLPDGLWMFAFSLFILLIWDFKIHRSSLTWITIVLVAGTGFECMQGLDWIAGWFDPFDMIFILAGTGVPVIYLLIKKRLCKTN